MKHMFFLLLATLLVTGIQAQTLLNEGFDNGIPPSWTLLNDDNSTTYPNYADAWVGVMSTGNPAPCVGSISMFSPAAQADRWLITPPVVLPDNGDDYTFSLDALAFGAPSLADGFQVRVSTVETENPSRADFSAPLLSIPAATNEFLSYSLSLAAYAGQTIRVAIVQNSYNKNVLLVDNVSIVHLRPLDVAPTAIALDDLLPLDTTVAPVVTLQNLGSQMVTSLLVTYQLDAQEPVTDTLSGLALQPSASLLHTLRQPLSLASAGTHTLSVVATPNMVDSLASEPLLFTFAVYDPAQAVERTSLVEMFTTSMCGNCPPAHDRIDAALASRPNVLLLCHHAGYYTDVMTTPDDEAMLWFYNSSSTYAPGVMYDRTNFPAFGADPSSQGQYRPDTPVLDPWDEGLCMDIALAVPSFATVDFAPLQYDPASRQLTVTVSGRLGVRLPNSRLSVYLVQDSIWAYQTYPVGDTILHHDVYRLALNGLWGESIDTGDFSLTYTLTLPERIGTVPLHDWRCRLLALVGNYNPAVPNDCRIQNAALSPRLPAPCHSASVEEAFLPVAPRLFPNPCGGELNVECGAWSDGLTAQVVDLQGRVVLTAPLPAPATTLNLSSLAKGTYLLRVGPSVQKIVIQ